MRRTEEQQKQLQMMRFIQVSSYQTKYALTDEEMANRIGITKERYVELSNDCTQIAPDEIMKFSLALNIHPTSLLVNFTLDNSYLNQPLYYDFNNKLDNWDSNVLAKAIAYAISNNRIIILDEKLYWVGVSHRVRNELTLEERRKMAEVCLKEHFIDAVRFLSYNENILGINSLDELNFLSEEEKNMYLYGKPGMTTEIPLMLGLPSYFEVVANDLSKEEKLEMYQTALKFYERSVQYINSLDEEIIKLLGYDFLETEKEIEILQNKIKELN